jgi:hypothetical protein
VSEAEVLFPVRDIFLSGLPMGKSGYNIAYVQGNAGLWLQSFEAS